MMPPSDSAAVIPRVSSFTTLQNIAIDSGHNVGQLKSPPELLRPNNKSASSGTPAQGSPAQSQSTVHLQSALDSGPDMERLSDVGQLKTPFDRANESDARGTAGQSQI